MPDLGMTVLHYTHGTAKKQNDFCMKKWDHAQPLLFRVMTKEALLDSQTESTGVSPTNLRAHVMVSHC